MELPAETNKQTKTEDTFFIFSCASPGPLGGSSTADTPGTGGRSRRGLGTHREPAGSVGEAGAGGSPLLCRGVTEALPGCPVQGTPIGSGRRTRSPGCCPLIPIPNEVRGVAPLPPSLRWGGGQGGEEAAGGEGRCRGKERAWALQKKIFWGKGGWRRL